MIRMTRRLSKVLKYSNQKIRHCRCMQVGGVSAEEVLLSWLAGERRRVVSTCRQVSTSTALPHLMLCSGESTVRRAALPSLLGSTLTADSQMSRRLETKL